MSECETIKYRVKYEEHFNQKHHDGGWHAIGAYATNADPTEQKRVPGATYRPTEALDDAPYLAELIETFDATKNESDS